jgi:hypothetical protein
MTQCPNCRVALVAEEPEAPPRVAGWRIDEQTERYLAPIRGGFGNGLQTAREAFRLTFSARKLLIVVGVLVTLYSVGQTVQYRLLFPARPNPGIVIPERPSDEDSFLGKCLNRLKNEFSAYNLEGDFGTPLAKPTGATTPWVYALTTRQMQGYFGEMASRNKSARWRGFIMSNLLALWEGILLGGISALLEAVLLGWLFAMAAGTAIKNWSNYIKSYFIPLFVLGFCIYMGIAIITMPLQLLDYFHSHTIRPGSLETLRTIFYSVIPWLFFFALIILALAPFAIVGRNLGAWGGVKAGARILWQRGWTFLALLIGYRVVYEIIFMIIGSLPTLSRTVMFTNLPLYSVTGWVLNMGLALLGLWLAMCFTMLVLPKQEAAKDDGLLACCG